MRSERSDIEDKREELEKHGRPLNSFDVHLGFEHIGLSTRCNLPFLRVLLFVHVFSRCLFRLPGNIGTYIDDLSKSRKHLLHPHRHDSCETSNPTLLNHWSTFWKVNMSSSTLRNDSQRRKATAAVHTTLPTLPFTGMRSTFLTE